MALDFKSHIFQAFAHVPRYSQWLLEAELESTYYYQRRVLKLYVEDFRGHCWEPYLFPSGKAFGYNAYPPRNDGKPTYIEGYVFDGDGELMPARVIKAPWLSRLEPYGDDVSCVLETPRGNIEIRGQTWVSTFAMGRPNMPPNFPVLQQRGVRYTWDGEEGFGMMERSIRKGKLAC